MIVLKLFRNGLERYGGLSLTWEMDKTLDDEK